MAPEPVFSGLFYLLCFSLLRTLTLCRYVFKRQFGHSCFSLYTDYSISLVLWSYKLQKDVRAFSGGENADGLCQCYVFFALAVNKSKILSYYEGYTLYYWITGDFLSLIRRRRQELSVSRSHITEINPTIKYLFHCFFSSVVY